MTHVQDFDASLAFIHAESQLSKLKPAQVFESKPTLSLTLAYMYVIMKYQQVVLVDREVFTLLSDFFPGLVKLKSSNTVGMTITQVDTSVAAPVYLDGELLMPIYLSETSTIVYNIHSTKAEAAEYTNELVVGALNFFNCIVRSQTAGTKRVIWKDPAVLSTRLQSANYDRMFAIFIADKYLSSFESDYPVVTEPLRTLAMCLRVLELLEEGSSKAVTFQVQEFTEELASLLILPEVVSANIQLSAGILVVDSMKRDLCAVLYYLRTRKADRRFKLYLTGFKDKRYEFLNILSKLYPLDSFTVYEKVTTRVPKRDNIRTISKILSPRDLKSVTDPEVILFSLLDSNNALITAFKGQCIVAQASTTYTPDSVYCSCFTSGTETVAYSIISPERKLGKSEELTELTSRVRHYSRELELKYRDTKRWKYSIEGDTLSFDEAMLRYLGVTKALMK